MIIESMAGNTAPASKRGRLLSLDVMRGMIMILLAAEACHLYVALQQHSTSGPAARITEQFFHHPWHGLRFWDLVQPAFMTMAGAALFISSHSRFAKGVSWTENLRHVLVRCFRLFVCGTALHCVYAGQMVWELWNVLTQLAFTTLIAYLIIRKPVWIQVLISVLLLCVTEWLYRYISKPGFEEPFVHSKNFGAWFDLQLMGKINSDGWVAINIIPTAAHTIWGMIAGRVLVSSMSAARKLGLLAIAGLIALVTGFALDWLEVTPIIKRISTSSFVLASGGWVLWILALLYWMHDVKHWNRFAWIFTVVGMNAIFIYLFFETVGVQWLNPTVAIFTNGITSLFTTSPPLQCTLAAFVTLCLEWALCYWLFLRKIFFKL